MFHRLFLIQFHFSFFFFLFLILKMLKLNRKLKKSLELNKTYSESEYFSQRHRQWKRYSVNKPRLPKNIDINEKWLETLFQPRTLKTFVGKHNNEVNKLFFFFIIILLLLLLLFQLNLFRLLKY